MRQEIDISPEPTLSVSSLRTAKVQDCEATAYWRLVLDRASTLINWNGGAGDYGRIAVGDTKHACPRWHNEQARFLPILSSQSSERDGFPRERKLMNKHGFLRSAPRAKAKRVHDFQVGDYVTLNQPEESIGMRMDPSDPRAGTSHVRWSTDVRGQIT